MKSLLRKKVKQLEKKVKELSENYMNIEKAVSQYSLFNRKGWSPFEILVNEVYYNTIYINKLKGKK